MMNNKLKHVGLDAFSSQTLAQVAEDYFTSGWSCSEAVFLAICDALGKKGDVELSTLLGTGFGGKGHACGALTGALVALGYKYGRKNTDKEAKNKAYRIASEFYDMFRHTFHSTECWELTEQEPDSVERKKMCIPTVRKTAELVGNLLKESV